MEKIRKYSKIYIPNSISLVVLLILFLFNIATASGQVISFPGDPMDGKLVFENKGCKNCHAIQGQGAKIASDLSKNLYYGSFLQLAGVMWNHAPKMLKKAKKMDLEIEQFTHDEMSDLIAYLGYLNYLGQPGNKFRGRKLLSKKKCVKCHKFGDEGTAIGPDLSELSYYVSPLYITQAMWNHGPVIEKQINKMNFKFIEFKNNEIIDITEAIKSYSNPTEFKAEFMLPGNPKLGENLFQTKQCSHCHAVNGKGGNLGPDFSEKKLNYSVTKIAGVMWNHGPKMWELMQKEGISHPYFDGTEMADVIAYIYFVNFNDQSGDADRGKIVFLDKGCIDCHSVKGKGGAIAPDLAEIKDIISPISMVQIMWNHAPTMVDKLKEQKIRWPKFEGNNVPDLYAYLQSVKKKEQ